MDPLKELVKKSVGEFLREGNWPAAKQRYTDLSSKIKDRTDLDLWFDEQVRRCIVPVMMKEKRYEEVMAIYDEQSKRNSTAEFAEKWDALIKIKSTDEEESQNDRARNVAGIVSILLLTVIGGIYMKLHPDSYVGIILFISIIILFFMFTKGPRKDPKQIDDPIRREYERRKRARENR